MKKARVLTVIVCVMAAVNFASADIIRGINIDFVTIGNAGNAGEQSLLADYSDTTYFGGVNYEYQIGKYEVTNAQWNVFTTAAGTPTGNPSEAYNESATFTGAQQPANEVSWYEAAQFCNFLTSGDKSKGAYQFSGNNTNPGDFLGINRNTAISSYGIAYVIPTEDEWYKAAYFKSDGSGYSLYANGQNTIPAADNGWNYYGGSYNTPWNVGTGTQEQNSTFDMMANVWEWNETLIIPSGTFPRGARGSSFEYDDVRYMSPMWRWFANPPESEYHDMGFRIASVPEPATLLLLGLGAAFLKKPKK
jgi:formylglycine-generating enzyme